MLAEDGITVESYMANEYSRGGLLSEGMVSKWAVAAQEWFVGRIYVNAQAESMAIKIELSPSLLQPASAPERDQLLGVQPSNVGQHPRLTSVQNTVVEPPAPTRENAVEVPQLPPQHLPSPVPLSPFLVPPQLPLLF